MDISKYIRPDGTIEKEAAIELVLEYVYTDTVLNKLYPSWPGKEGHARGIVRQRINDATAAGHIEINRKTYSETYYKACDFFKWAPTTKGWQSLQGIVGLPKSADVCVSGLSAVLAVTEKVYLTM